LVTLLESKMTEEEILDLDNTELSEGGSDYDYD
jgi:hypothetical protein